MPTLAHIARLTTHVEFRCRRCPRHGRYRCTTLLARFAPGTEMHVIIDAMAVDCPRAGATQIYELCQAHCPTLVELG